MIGVLGGMGPAATLDFLAELVRLTTVERDQDHVPVVVLSDPRISIGSIVEGRGLAARAACLDAPKPWPAPARVAPGARSGDG